MSNLSRRFSASVAEAKKPPKPVPEIMPALKEAVAKKASGKYPTKTHNKTKISVWISNEAIEKLKATGPGWQGLINEIVEAYVAKDK